MKILFCVLVAVSLLAALLPIPMAIRHPYPQAVSSPAVASSTMATPTPSTPSAMASTDRETTVRLRSGDALLTLSMEEYLVGVVAAEMPVSFSPEALRAQATAARTCTLYNMTVQPNAAHPEADACDDPACCKAWYAQEALTSLWGDSSAEKLAIITQAVRDTDGVVVVYAEAPALCVFHSSSSGLTESSADVWGGTLPYLVSVPSPETSSDVPGYVSSVVILQSEFRSVIQHSFPDAVLDGLPGDWITERTVTSGGRVSELTVGGVRIAGTELRRLFSLRSTAFTVEITEQDVVFTVTGYGHGVGMSQYGAEVLARDGADWKEILAWYYPGTTLGSLRDYLPI